MTDPNMTGPNMTGPNMTEPVAIRPAASVILWRQDIAGPQVLMGQRGAAAVFMPSKYVFPGGGVDATDHSTGHLSALCQTRLARYCPPNAPTPEALCGCTLRELTEETGFHLPPFAPLQFIFRAITPPGAPRRFDARFFLAKAALIAGDLEDFSAATDELRHLHWIGQAEARRLDLPFITEIILAEVAALLAGNDQPGVPFFDNQGPVPVFRRLA